MADEDDQNQLEDEGTDDGDAGEGQPRKTFSQDQLTKIVQRREKKAGNEAVKGLLAELGLDSPDALKSLIQQQKERDDAEKSELDKARAAAAEAKAEAEQAKAEAATLKLRDALREELITLVPANKLAAAMKLGFPVVLESDEDEIGERVSAAIESVKADMPEWFEPHDDDQQGKGSRTPPPPSRTNGQRQATKSNAPENAYERRKGKRAGRIDVFGSEGKK